VYSDGTSALKSPESPVKLNAPTGEGDSDAVIDREKTRVSHGILKQRALELQMNVANPL
jgi:hypothetical protein